MFKEILEIAKKIGREFHDPIAGLDSNPEHIVVFPYHKPDCSRTQPLRVIYEGDIGGLPWGGYLSDSVNPRKVLVCNECEGKEG